MRRMHTCTFVWDLQSLPALDEAFVRELTIRLPTLRHLAIRACFSTGITGVTVLQELVPCFQRLRFLDVRDNNWLDDESLQLFAAACADRGRAGKPSRLLVIKLAGCDSITAAGTRDVLMASLPELRKLEYEDDEEHGTVA